ncbi:MAG: hypothetical protein EWM73_03353 [Nitrospira sp.]|nr:MAG: hypothetical protein EWM73_03353 [Nitrospira sp.]
MVVLLVDLEDLGVERHELIQDRLADLDPDIEDGSLGVDVREFDVECLDAGGNGLALRHSRCIEHLRVELALRWCARCLLVGQRFYLRERFRLEALGLLRGDAGRAGNRCQGNRQYDRRQHVRGLRPTTVHGFTFSATMH